MLASRFYLRLRRPLIFKAGLRTSEFFPLSDPSDQELHHQDQAIPVKLYASGSSKVSSFSPVFCSSRRIYHLRMGGGQDSASSSLQRRLQRSLMNLGFRGRLTSGAVHFVCFGSEFNLSANLSRLSPISTGSAYFSAWLEIGVTTRLYGSGFSSRSKQGAEEISVYSILEAGLSRNLGRIRGLFVVPMSSCGDVGSSSLDFQGVWISQAGLYQASWGGCSFRCRRVLAGWTLLLLCGSSPVFFCLSSFSMYRLVKVVTFSLESYRGILSMTWSFYHFDRVAGALRNAKCEMRNASPD
ncbi:hypothetical protein FPV67DRAFT_269932 [Lyophyllum atratum]|nr:hypothetical protein FPV67DRAFT_269932 [Lyophyllum atratum]